MDCFNKKIALVSGASRGFGAAVAKALARRGCHVIALARTSGGLEELDDRIRAAGGSTTLVPLDICDAPALSRLGLAIHERWGGLDFWIHCAVHAPPLTPAGHIDAKDWKKATDVNINATCDLIINISPLLEAKKGMAVHLVDQVHKGKFFASYCSGKAAQKAMFECWQEETRNIGPRVIGFAPGAMPTATRARFFPGEDKTILHATDVEAKRLMTILEKETAKPPAQTG